MSDLSDLLGGMKVPRVLVGRLSAAERDAALEAIDGSKAAVQAGTSRVKAFEAVLAAALSGFAQGFEAHQLARAAESMRKAAEAELAAKQAEEGGEG